MGNAKIEGDKKSKEKMEMMAGEKRVMIPKGKSREGINSVDNGCHCSQP